MRTRRCMLNKELTSTSTRSVVAMALQRLNSLTSPWKRNNNEQHWIVPVKWVKSRQVKSTQTTKKASQRYRPAAETKPKVLLQQIKNQTLVLLNLIEESFTHTSDSLTQVNKAMVLHNSEECWEIFSERTNEKWFCENNKTKKKKETTPQTCLIW